MYDWRLQLGWVVGAIVVQESSQVRWQFRVDADDLSVKGEFQVTGVKSVARQKQASCELGSPV